MKLRTLRLSLIVGFTVLTGCSDVIGIDQPLEKPGARKYFDEPFFRPLWIGLEACSKLSGDLHSVHFYSVAAVTLPSSLHGIRTVGMYFPSTNRIFILQSEMWNTKVIRHEMMHALLKDESGHPAKYFGSDGLCGYL
jgi:hypothetical protein